MNNIVIVTNESSIVDSSLKLVYENPSFVKIENVNAIDDTGYARWIETDGTTSTELMAVPSEANTYNILRIPMAGLVYMVAHARKHNLVNDCNMVVCMKELYPTQAFSMEKYHLFMYGKQKISVKTFEEWFSISDGGNPFLTEEFDDIIEMISENKFLHLSEKIYSLL